MKKFQGKRERQVFITYTCLPIVESRHAAESEDRMSEAMTNQAAMYDSVEAVRNLNSVEGFNPRDCMRVIQGEVAFTVPGGKNQQAAVKAGE